MSYAELMGQASEIQRKAVHEATIRYLSCHPSEYRTPSLDRQAQAEIERTFEDIPDLFRPYADLPDPASFKPPIDLMIEALKKLSTGERPTDPIGGELYRGNPELDKVSGAESFIEDWTGRAAMEFKSNFIDPFPTVVRNQVIIAAVLRSALAAEQEIWATAREDIEEIAHKTIEALDRINDCGKNEWTITFTVVASVAAIAAVPLTGGAGLAVAAVGASSQVMAAVAPEDPPKTRFSGESPEAVISAMREAIAELTKHICDQEQKIASALRTTHELVARERSLFVSRRPELADATASNVTGPAYLGYAS